MMQQHILSVEELLADQQIDAVSICVANNAHAEISIQALNCGKHVLLRKNQWQRHWKTVKK